MRPGIALARDIGRQGFDPACSQVAGLPRRVDLVTGLLRMDGVLWAAQHISWDLGGRHRWRADAEAMA